MKKTLSLLLALAMALSLVSFGAYASEEPEELTEIEVVEEAEEIMEPAVPSEEEELPALDGGFVIDENGVLISYSGSSGGVTIPYYVTEIGDGAFRDCTSIYGLEIPGSVARVGENAFSGCTNMTEVKIAEGVRTLGKNSFANCKALKTLKLPASLTEIGDGAFSGCGSLTSVSFAGAVDQWEAVAIGENNEALTGLEVSFGAGPTAGSGFDTALPIALDEEVTADVKQYNKTEGKRHAFYKFTPEAEERYLISVAGDLNAITGATGFTYPSCSVYDEDGSRAGGNANESRNTYVLQAGRTYYLEVYAKRGDTVKLQITVAHEYDHNICIFCGDKRLFTGEKNGLTWTILGDELTISGDGIVDPDFLRAIDGKSEIRSVVVEEGITAIDDENWVFDHFGSFPDLEKITLPESLTVIGPYVFSDCAKLTEIELPAGLTKLGYGAFQRCSALTEITLPAGITEVDWRTFYGCTSLASVTLPEGLVKIDGSAFAGCSSLKTLELPDTVTEIGEDAFSDTGLESFVWPEKCRGIGKNTFSGCADLVSITIPAGVRSIGEDAFAGCNSLGEVRFGGSLGQWWQLSDEHAALAAAEVQCADPSEEYLSGVEGDGVTWTLDIHGNLVITGEGATDSYIKERFRTGTWQPGMPLFTWSPFQEHRDRISTVYLDKGVTYIGTNLFYRCDINDVYYSGDQAQWDAMTVTEGNNPLMNANLHLNSLLPGEAAPTPEPTAEPTAQPTTEPTAAPTTEPTAVPTAEPTTQPTTEPTAVPTAEPTTQPTTAPTTQPTAAPSSSRGDCNGDGKVNRQDRIYLARSLAGWENYPIPEEAVADLTGDGKINRQDRIQLARALAGWEGYTLDE